MSSRLLQSTSRQRRRQRGFTLIELAINVAITGVIVVALGGTSVVGYAAINRSNATMAGDNATASVSVALTRDISSAAGVSPALPVTLTPSAGSITFTPAGSTPARTYTIDAAGNVVRTVGGAATVAARGIAQLQFAAGSSPCQMQVTITASKGTLGAQGLTVARRMQGC
jgi:prepilin-type N-terminal cleavage/methylation domain-containing protein